MSPHVVVDREALAGFCRRHGIRRLAVFGQPCVTTSALRSDIDVLVEFELGRTPGLAFFHDAGGVQPPVQPTVDLHTPASLSRYFRAAALAEARDQHVAA